MRKMLLAAALAASIATPALATGPVTIKITRPNGADQTAPTETNRFDIRASIPQDCTLITSNGGQPAATLDFGALNIKSGESAGGNATNLFLLRGDHVAMATVQVGGCNFASEVNLRKDNIALRRSGSIAGLTSAQFRQDLLYSATASWTNDAGSQQVTVSANQLEQEADTLPFRSQFVLMVTIPADQGGLAPVAGSYSGSVTATFGPQT